MRGRLSQLTHGGDTTAYQAVAHAYLHGADYGVLALWMSRDEAQLRKTVRDGLKELAL